METNTTQASSFPEPTGAYAVGTTSFYFADPEREETFTRWDGSVEAPIFQVGEKTQQSTFKCRHTD